MAEVREQRQRQRAAGREERRAGAEEPAAAAPQLKRAAATAAAAALAGALAGGAKAFADKRGRPDEKSRDLTPDGSEPGRSPEPEPEPEPEQEPEPVDQAHDEDEWPEHGAASGEVAEIIGQAREHVQSVLGSEADSVSGIERSNGHWCVTVEVVQLRRIPESTDVLASYAVVLDDDGGLISLRQARRYRRSQADEER